MANKYLTMTGICQSNIEKLINATIGRWTRYIQYDPSDMNRNVLLNSRNLLSASPMNPKENIVAQLTFIVYFTSSDRPSKSASSRPTQESAMTNTA